MLAIATTVSAVRPGLFRPRCFAFTLPTTVPPGKQALEKAAKKPQRWPMYPTTENLSTSSTYPSRRVKQASRSR
jgi:hypothetical protein